MQTDAWCLLYGTPTSYLSRPVVEKCHHQAVCTKSSRHKLMAYAIPSGPHSPFFLQGLHKVKLFVKVHNVMNLKLSRIAHHVFKVVSVRTDCIAELKEGHGTIAGGVHMI
jgi:hypothetical protein